MSGDHCYSNNCSTSTNEIQLFSCCHNSKIGSAVHLDEHVSRSTNATFVFDSHASLRVIFECTIVWTNAIDCVTISNRAVAKFQGILYSIDLRVGG